MKNPIFVALDLDDLDSALRLAKKCNGRVGGYKVGPRLLMKYGPRVVSELAPLAPVFVDNKYYDIPSTMLSSLRATFEAGASFATIHAQAGAQALSEIARLEKELNQKRSFRVLAVTVLTSYSENNLPPNWRAETIDQHVRVLAAATFGSGLSGLVCSPHEVASMRAQFPESFLVTPGIRLEDEEAQTKVNKSAADDQTRIMTPKKALSAGASALVIGRPIIESQDPARTLDQILASL